MSDPIDGPVNFIVVVEPEQIGLAPVIVTVPVGNGLSVTVALPVRSPAWELQFASLNVAIVKVVGLEEGVTTTLIGLLLPLND